MLPPILILTSSVELIGGCATAKQLILTAIEHGKHVVTANKALIAEHGNELFQAAQKKGVIIAYEGSCSRRYTYY